MNASRQSLIVSAVICVLLAALFVARYLLAPYPAEAPFEGGMPLAAALARFSTTMPWLSTSLAVVIVVWTLLVVVQLTIKYAPAASRNYLPAQIFLIAVGGTVVSGEALAALTVAWLMALAAQQLVFSFHKGYSFPELFHAGFYLGLIPLLYAPAVIVVLPATLTALTIYRRSGREAIVCLAGLALPVPAAGFIHLATGAEGGFIWRELWRCLSEARVQEQFPPYSAVAVAVLVMILALIGIVWALGHKKNVRKTQYKFIVHTSFVLLLVVASACVPGTSTTLAAFAAVPCALTIPYAFQGKAAATSTVVYCLVVVAVFALNLLPVLGISLP